MHVYRVAAIFPEFLQALATVSLSKDPIISLILLFRSSVFFEALR
jgi:hypothetical protein